MARRTVKSMYSDIDKTISTLELELQSGEAKEMIIRAQIAALLALRSGTLPDITRG
jgi:inorganic triphosphatase YgiF